MLNQLRNVLAIILSISCLVTATAAAVHNQKADYYGLIREIQQWHETNPNACGHDTPTCGAQKLVDGFSSCNNDFRIVNGCKNDYAESGWTVGTLTGPMLCTGTLVSPRHVVLAAHCVDGITTPATVYIGNRSLRNASLTAEQKYHSVSFAMHPAYNRLAAANDSAIIKLERDVPLSPTGSRPACLPTSGTPRTLTNCLAAGYGVNDNDPNSKDDGAGRLRYTVLDVVKDSKCYRAYGDGLYGYHPEVSFCGVGKHGSNGSDTCTGDSGAGFVCKDAGGRWTLQGIVSYGPPQCGSVPSVYSDAYVLGIQNPTSIRRRNAGDACGGSNTNSNFGVGDSSGFGSGLFVSPTRAPSPPSPPSFSGDTTGSNPSFDQIFGSPQFGGFGGASGSSGKKKTGGLFATIGETVRNSGCSAAAECMSNVCKPASLCTSARGLMKFRILTPTVIDDEKFNPMPRPAKPVKVEDERRAEFTPRMCRSEDICWPSVWIDAFASAKPMFEFNS